MNFGGRDLRTPRGRVIKATCALYGDEIVTGDLAVDLTVIWTWAPALARMAW